jgi:ParB-like chromosome segregation protein Spo0J
MNQNTELEFHEAANIFPLDEDHLEDLAADIRKNGQQVAIELFDGRILDGRRRYLACNKVGIEPKFREVKVSDPIAYVLSLNLYRRHLNPSQWAMVGARARDIYDRQAKERQKGAASSTNAKMGRSHNQTLMEN